VEIRIGPEIGKGRIAHGGTETTTANVQGDIDRGAAPGIESATINIDITHVHVRVTDGDMMIRTTGAGIDQGAASTGDETTAPSAVENELRVMSVRGHVREIVAEDETLEADRHTSQSRPEDIEGTRHFDGNCRFLRRWGTRIAHTWFNLMRDWASRACSACPIILVLLKHSVICPWHFCKKHLATVWAALDDIASIHQWKGFICIGTSHTI
jgi:hypothetical protein